MNLKELRLKLNWEIVKDVPNIIKMKKFKHSNYYACKIDAFQSKDWQLIFHFVVGGKNSAMVAVRMHLDADPLFDLHSHWITDNRAGIKDKAQNYDPLTLARIRLMRLVYDLCDDMENHFDEQMEGYDINYNKEIQIEIYNSGQINYHN